MAGDNEISQLHIVRQMHDRQRRLGNILRKNNIPLKTVSFESGIPYNTLRTYFPSEQQELFPSIMPISALVQLFGVIKDEWLSVLTEPEGKCFSSTGDDDGAVAELTEARDHLNAALAKVKARASA